MAVTFTFIPSTLIKSAEVNQNFAEGVLVNGSQPADALSITPTASNSINNSFWIDSTDSDKLKFRDNGGFQHYVIIETSQDGYIPIEDVFPDLTSPPIPGLIGLNPCVEYEKIAVEKSYFSFQVPIDCDTTQSITVQLWYAMTTTAVGDVKFNFDSSAFVATEDVNAVAQNSTTETITAPATVDLIDYLDSTSLLIPTSILSPNKLVNCMISRDSTHVNDTHTGNLRLLNIRLKYKRLL